MVRDCRPDDIGVSVSYPLPGTRFYEPCAQQLGDKQNWADSSDLAMTTGAIHAPRSTASCTRFVHKEFRARKLWRAEAGAAGARPGRANCAWQRALLPGHAAPGALAPEPAGPPAPPGVSPFPPALPPEAAARPTPRRGILRGTGMDDHLQQVAQAFSQKAGPYDSFGNRT